jgi:ATP-dependent DNA helicase RecQ
VAADADPAAIFGVAMDARAALHTHFGFEDFRRGQAEAVAAALGDRDSLVVMPTGSGKSLCYQLPALMRDDVTIVVSPLVSLMQDQVEALERIAPGRVELVNAQRGGAANARTLERVVGGEVSLLYLAPERFASPGFVNALRQARIGLFVVDEAHCVSQWGHDFRPEYFRLADAARHLEARAIMALTATATPPVAVDIARRLRLRDPVSVTTGFDRPNLSFAVVPCATDADRQRRLVAALGVDGALPAIVYAGTRNACESVAAVIRSGLGLAGEDVVVYHAGLNRERRAAAQRRFMGGEAQVVVATNAFGMGVDKADVRTVAHTSVPQSLEAYYQEAGRGGRDGAPAQCLLFSAQKDKGLHVFFIERARVADWAFERVWMRLRSGAVAGHSGRYDVSLAEVAAVASGEGRGDEDQARAILGHLVRAQVIEPAPAPPDRAAGRLRADWDRRAYAASRSSANDAERIRWRQYRAIWEFVESGRCRRTAMLRHFGDHAAPSPGVPCCDVCAPALVLPPEPAPVRVRRDASGRPAVRRPAQGAAPGAAIAAVPELEAAILDVVRTATPAVGRTRAVEILRGGRSKVIAEYSYDALRDYGAFAHLHAADVMHRVDAMLQAGSLRSTGGRFPKLKAA